MAGTTPQPLTLDDILSRVTEFVGDGDDAKDRAASLGKALIRTEATKPIADIIKRRGANEQQGAVHRATARVTELEGQLALVNEQLEEKDAALQQLQGAQPDFARRLRETEEKYQKRIRELETGLEGEVRGRRDDILSNHRERLLQMLLPYLADEDYARYTALPKYQQYLELDDAKQLVVKEPGEGVPYDRAKGDLLKQLVADALEEIPAKYRAIPAADAGGGAPARASGGPVRPKTVEEIREIRKRSGIYAMVVPWAVLLLGVLR